MNTATMKPQDVMAQLKGLGSPVTRKVFAAHGAGDNQFGVPLGKLRGLAKSSRPITRWGRSYGTRATPMP